MSLPLHPNSEAADAINRRIDDLRTDFHTYQSRTDSQHHELVALLQVKFNEVDHKHLDIQQTIDDNERTLEQRLVPCENLVSKFDMFCSRSFQVGLTFLATLGAAVIALISWLTARHH